LGAAERQARALGSQVQSLDSRVKELEDHLRARR
jgi:hypothetical protein